MLKRKVAIKATLILLTLSPLSRAESISCSEGERKCENSYFTALERAKDESYSCIQKKNCSGLGNDESGQCIENCRVGEEIILQEISDCFFEAKKNLGNCED